MKTLFALIFCVSVMLLMVLSGGLKQNKPQVRTLVTVNLYDKIDCMQECPEHKVVGTVAKGEVLTVLSSLKGKTKSVLRVEHGEQAGWMTYDLEKVEAVNPDAKKEKTK